MLCLGHADRLELSSSSFERIEPIELFLYRKPARASAPAPSGDDAQPPRAKPVPSSAWVPPASPVLPRRVESSVSRELLLAAVPTATVPSEQTARELADLGQYDAALACCQQLLHRQGPSANLYALLGAIHLARQDPDTAALCLQRALYLDPEHREALWQQWLLHRSRGETDRAQRLRARLDRLDEKGEGP